MSEIEPSFEKNQKEAGRIALEMNNHYIKMLFVVNGAGTIAVLSLTIQLYAQKLDDLARQMVSPITIFITGVISVIIMMATTVILLKRIASLEKKEDMNSGSFRCVQNFLSFVQSVSYAWAFIAIVWGVWSVRAIMLTIIM